MQVPSGYIHETIGVVSDGPGWDSRIPQVIHLAIPDADLMRDLGPCPLVEFFGVMIPKHARFWHTEFGWQAVDGVEVAWIEKRRQGI